MEILQINSVCGVGSTGRIATDLHAILLSKGHLSTIAYGRDLAKNCKKTIRIGTLFDNYLHVAKTRFFDAHGFGSATATKKLIKQIQALNPDVIHLHNLHGYYLNIRLFFDYLKHVGTPVVWTLHDCWSFTGHCAYFDFIGCERWILGCHDCPLKTEYPKSIALDRSQWNYQQKKRLFTGVKNLTLVTPSHWLSQLIKQSFLRDYSVEVINNGIDINVFKPTRGNFRKKYKLEKQFIILGVASVWEERKGYGYLLEIASQLKPDETLVLVGLTEKQLNSLPVKVMGVAKTDSTLELAEIYSTADVFVNPTLEDNFPTTNLEALACGTPVLTFDSGGSPECLDDRCGLVVPRGDFKKLVAAIATVKKFGKRSYSIHCQQRAIDLFDKNSRFLEYLNLYQKISG